MLAFGTDGVRGDTRSDFTEEFVEGLGAAAAEVFGPTHFAIGRDPRASGPAMVAALSRGIRAAGGSPVDLGVLPTPAVARWCDDHRAPGAMVSASHNPWHDNGVKLFSPGGHKLSDHAQNGIERRLAELVAPPENHESDRPAETWPDSAARIAHIEAVVASIEGRDLAPMTIVVDCANGAASVSGPECLRRLGAEVHAINASPNGRNINAGCGSLHPETLQQAVLARRADAGVAFDGDADRVIAVDHLGNLVDGDRILALCAVDRFRRGLLRGNAVAATVMANLGLRRALAGAGIAIVDTAVGDRHVLSTIEEQGLVLGGEQSGHLIFRDLATTGDGILTAVQLLDVVKRSGVPLAELASAAMTSVPQVLVGVPVGRPIGPVANSDLDRRLRAITSDCAQRLGDRGRVLVRPSGTEPLIRVMVEADDDALAQAEAARVASLVAEAVTDLEAVSTPGLTA